MHNDAQLSLTTDERRDAKGRSRGNWTYTD